MGNLGHFKRQCKAGINFALEIKENSQIETASKQSDQMVSKNRPKLSNSVVPDRVEIHASSPSISINKCEGFR
jgi:hypothetical protein